MSYGEIRLRASDSQFVILVIKSNIHCTCRSKSEVVELWKVVELCAWIAENLVILVDESGRKRDVF